MNGGIRNRKNIFKNKKYKVESLGLLYLTLHKEKDSITVFGRVLVHLPMSGSAFWNVTRFLLTVNPHAEFSLARISHKGKSEKF